MTIVCDRKKDNYTIICNKQIYKKSKQKPNENVNFQWT